MKQINTWKGSLGFRVSWWENTQYFKAAEDKEKSKGAESISKN